MDNFYNYHHQWHHGPPQANSICPVCSTPHFPFCPPYHPHNPQNPGPNFPPHHQFPRPGFDPILHHHHLHHHHHSPYIDPVDSGAYQGGGYGVDLEGRDRSFKRPRVDEIGSGYRNPRLSEIERRLQLIRDHGGGGAGASSPLTPPLRPGNPHMYNFEEPVVPGLKDRKRPFSEQGNHCTDDYQNGFHYNGPASAPTLPPPSRGGGYLGGPGGQIQPQPPIQIYRPPSNFVSHSAPPEKPVSLFPVSENSSVVTGNSSYPHVPNAPMVSSGQSGTRGQSFQPKSSSSDKAKVIDASQLFKQPHRVTRPDHFVIILRGLPGSGKSYLAKMLRDFEVENGGSAPRIHSMDDYFMTEVEQVEENDASTSSSTGRSKRPVVKRVMEYCYEPEMEEAYRSSMLKAFKRTLEEGVFTFVIVDDRNLRVADFAQFWATAKRSGYEAYILEATYKDPAGCAARNLHGFSLDEIKKMAGQWEEAPSLYMQLDIKSLSQGDDLKESGIQEVDMDMEDDFGLQERKPEWNIASSTGDDAAEDLSKDENRQDAEGTNQTEEVKELSRSKWSNLEEDESEKSKVIESNSNAVSVLSQSYCKKGKSVHWGDQGGDTGFSISAARKANMPSLVIGPGAGYNLKSNPLSEEESVALANSIQKAKMRSVFQDQLRAELESFKAVFDRRKQRNVGIVLDDE